MASSSGWAMTNKTFRPHLVKPGASFLCTAKIKEKHNKKAKRKTTNGDMIKKRFQVKSFCCIRPPLENHRSTTPMAPESLRKTVCFQHGGPKVREITGNLHRIVLILMIPLVFCFQNGRCRDRIIGGTQHFALSHQIRACSCDWHSCSANQVCAVMCFNKIRCLHPFFQEIYLVCPFLLQHGSTSDGGP